MISRRILPLAALGALFGATPTKATLPVAVRSYRHKSVPTIRFLPTSNGAVEFWSHHDEVRAEILAVRELWRLNQ